MEDLLCENRFKYVSKEKRKKKVNFIDFPK